MRESALWRSFKKCVPSEAMAVRIENAVSSGVPDVWMTYRKKTIPIELKTDSEVSNKQSDWHRRWHAAGGESWFLIKPDDFLYLIPGSEKPFLARRWRVRDCREAIEKIFNV